MKHLNIKISGKVQGVFFRAETQKKAQEDGIQGWVRNEPDGTVYIEAEGETEKIDDFVRWCHTGSKRARVGKVDQEEGDLQHFKGFEVRRYKD